MEKIESILDAEHIILEDLSLRFLRRILNLNMEISESFILSKEESIILRKKLPFERVNEPTLKKLVENLLVTKCLKNRRSDESLYELLKKNPSHRFYHDSFYYSKN